MRLSHLASLGAGIALTLTVGVGGCADKNKDDSLSPQEKKAAEQSDAKAKKGALTQKNDPAADLKNQKANLIRLRRNAEEDRLNGNRIGAWTAEHDAKDVQQLIAKDEQKLGERHGDE